MHPVFVQFVRPLNCVFITDIYSLYNKQIMKKSKMPVRWFRLALFNCKVIPLTTYFDFKFSICSYSTIIEPSIVPMGYLINRPWSSFINFDAMSFSRRN